MDGPRPEDFGPARRTGMSLEFCHQAGDHVETASLVPLTIVVLSFRIKSCHREKRKRSAVALALYVPDAVSRAAVADLRSASLGAPGKREHV
jgi:hypothetical protein